MMRVSIYLDRNERNRRRRQQHVCRSKRDFGRSGSEGRKDAGSTKQHQVDRKRMEEEDSLSKKALSL